MRFSQDSLIGNHFFIVIVLWYIIMSLVLFLSLEIIVIFTKCFYCFVAKMYEINNKTN